MDSHPNPLPGKNRRGLKFITNEKVVDNVAKESKSSVPSRFMQKRVFGVTRNTNMPLEKPEAQKPLALKTRKSLKPPVPPARSGRDAVRKIDSNKPTATTSKPTKNPIIQNATKKKLTVINSQEVLPSTPVLSKRKSKVIGTPYLSAQNWSKFTFDELESASYWIEQIELAESVGKHFVSITFFRLAKDCNAEPLHRLKTELKSYMRRHFSVSKEWNDLCKIYGLLDEGSDMASPKDDAKTIYNIKCDLTSEEHKHVNLAHDTNSMQQERHAENLNVIASELKKTSENEVSHEALDDCKTEGSDQFCLQDMACVISVSDVDTLGSVIDIDPGKVPSLEKSCNCQNHTSLDDCKTEGSDQFCLQDMACVISVSDVDTLGSVIDIDPGKVPLLEKSCNCQNHTSDCPCDTGKRKSSDNVDKSDGSLRIFEEQTQRKLEKSGDQLLVE